MASVCLGAENAKINVSRHRMDKEFETIEESVAIPMYAANHMKGVAAIVTLSSTGRTPLLMSRISSGLPIFALSRNQETLNLCALYRGNTNLSRRRKSYRSRCKSSTSIIKRKGYLSTGDLVLVTQGGQGATQTNVCRTLIVE